MAGFFSFFNKTSSNTTSKQTKSYSREEAENFVNRLEELGYFKYAAANDIPDLKQNMIDEFDPTNELVSIWEDDTPIPKDYRYYFCDNETLYEAGGFADMLQTIKPTLNKIGLQINVTDHYEVWDETNHWLDHTITINGTKYTVFKQFTEAGWGEAVQRLVEILNKELEIQEKEDRVYPVSGGNDGRIIFLSEEQFKLIDRVYINKLWKPLQLKDWLQVMEVEYMHVD